VQHSLKIIRTGSQDKCSSR